MGTVPLVESFTDPRNFITLLAYSLIATLVWIAFVSENRQQSTLIVMVSSFCFYIEKFFFFFLGFLNSFLFSFYFIFG